MLKVDFTFNIQLKICCKKSMVNNFFVKRYIYMVSCFYCLKREYLDMFGKKCSYQLIVIIVKICLKELMTFVNCVEVQVLLLEKKDLKIILMLFSHDLHQMQN